MLRVTVCVSGGGTNLQAIIDRLRDGTIKNTKIVQVISNNPGARALQRAADAGIPALCVSPGSYPDREAFNEALLEKINEASPDLIVLAGFMVAVPAQICAAYAGRIINVHPALIPSFCGKGYYGLHVHEEVLARGVKVTGATVHFVDENLDTGPIILQKAVEIMEDDTPQTLQRRVMEQAEWIILPRAIDLIAAGRVRIEGRRTRILAPQEGKELVYKKENMKVLLVGGGGREHAIADAITRSSRVAKLYCAPGNAGIAAIAQCVPIGTMDFSALIRFAKEEEIDLTVCSMDDPLCAGIVDAFEAEGLRIFGTPSNAAIIEGSKAFSKDLMKKYGIPTAAYETFDDAEKALAYLETASFPIVLKASGLALGKGVLICEDSASAKEGIRELMLDKKFGEAGSSVVIEQFMTGREVSVLAFVDGTHYQLMTSSQDHKRQGDGDTGLNTGGMGTFSPSPFYTPQIDAWCRENIYDRTVAAMAAEGRPFRGVLYFGLMLTPDGPRVLEYNTRFGDPETQVVLPRMKTDIVDVMDACIDGTLDRISLEFADNAAVCVVIASGGYPEAYEKGKAITGLEHFGKDPLYRCYHAGTSFDQDGKIVTSGGRVLGVTAIGGTLKEARKNAYEAAGWVHFDKMYMRSDIGKAIDAVQEENNE